MRYRLDAEATRKMLERDMLSKQVNEICRTMKAIAPAKEKRVWNETLQKWVVLR
jgi:hypothetical protein